MSIRSLVVDDDELHRELLRALLSPLGTVELATDGAAAVVRMEHAAAGSQPFRLICLDIRMPNLDGLGALRAIRAIEERQGVDWERRVRVLMTTAVDDLGDVMTAYRELADGYLLKPVQREALLRQLVEVGVLVR